MESKEMKKTMGAAVALSMVVGCVIGSGVFFKPQAIYTATGGAPGSRNFILDYRWVNNIMCRSDCCRNSSVLYRKLVV